MTADRYVSAAKCVLGVRWKPKKGCLPSRFKTTKSLIIYRTHIWALLHRFVLFILYEHNNVHLRWAFSERWCVERIDAKLHQSRLGGLQSRFILLHIRGFCRYGCTALTPPAELSSRPSGTASEQHRQVTTPHPPTVDFPRSQYRKLSSEGVSVVKGPDGQEFLKVRRQFRTGERGDSSIRRNQDACPRCFDIG